jgi:hypothetical protein
MTAVEKQTAFKAETATVAAMGAEGKGRIP